MMRAAKQSAQVQPALVVAQARSYFAPQSVVFSDAVTTSKPNKDTPSVLEEWKGKAKGTEQMMQLLQTYKDLGDSKNEPFLKYHNPRSFEDLSKPVPNFRALNLKSGEVPKFFDQVLTNRAAEAVEAKNKWWATRKAEATSELKKKSFQPFATIPVPEWSVAKPLSLDSLKSVTDKYYKGLEPKRKLSLPVVPATVKDSLASFAKSINQDKSVPEVTEMLTKFFAEKASVVEAGKVLEMPVVSKAIAAKALANRRQQVHERYVKSWAKKVLVTPELAAVPLKEVDAQLASKFEGMSGKYADVLQYAGAGKETYGERLAATNAADSFLIKKEKEELKADIVPSEAEVEGAKLAAKYDTPEAALAALLGPTASALGAGDLLLSEQVRAIAEHKYTPDRYMYKELIKLADKYAAEEAALKKELEGVYGADVDVKKFQQHPRTPVQQLLDRLKEVEASKETFAAEAKAAAESPYLQYAVAKKQEFYKDPSNLAFEEVLYPAIAEELMEIELAELKEQELMVEDAEEEELWMLTLAAQMKHLQKHFGIDLPHGVIAHMDPVLIKKIDWETTNCLEDWDQTLDEMGAEGAKEQWGVEALSHHFLPLIRYRRQKARKQFGSYEGEVAVPRSS